MRSKNIKDLSLYKLNGNNFLFDAMIKEFDKILLHIDLYDDDLFAKLYVDKRADGESVFNTIFPLWEISSENNQNNGFVYMLLGRKGIGKSITLKYYCRSEKEKNKKDIIYINLIDKQLDTNFKNNLSAELMNKIYDIIANEHKQLFLYLCEPEKIKTYRPEYEYYNPQELQKEILNKKTDSLKRMFRHLSDHNKYIYLIIDNIDDFPIDTVKPLIYLCIGLMQECHIRCIVALRNYWNLQRLRINDINLPSKMLREPNITEIHNKHFDAINVNRITEQVILEIENEEKIINADDLKQIYKNIVKQIENDKNIQEKLYKLVNYNIRDYMFIVYHFFHSPYLYSKPPFLEMLLKQIGFKTKGYRKLQYFDFIENAMAIHTLCYDTEASRIFNLFHHAYEHDDVARNNYRNTLIFIRILQQLPRVPVGTPRDKKDIITKLKRVGYDEAITKHAINTLLYNALIESFQGIKESDVEQLAISHKGIEYLELINEFSYLLYVCDDVPMPDEYKIDIEEKFGKEHLIFSNPGNLEKKICSVKLFLDFISSEENSEQKHCPSDSLDTLKQIRGDGITKEMKMKIQKTIDRLNSSPWKNHPNVLKIKIIKKKSD